MPKKIKLANVSVGKTIEIFGKKFTVLDHTDKGTLVLSNAIETDMPFREKYEADIAPNDYRYSDIRRYLNEEYLANLMDSPEDINNILYMSIDLKDTLGQREYGFFTTKAVLLTLEQYGKYFDIIPKINDCWWLATPYGTPTRSPFTHNASSVWYVRTSGYYGGYNCSNSCGVRPALLLKSSLLVAFDGVPNDTTPLSDFSDEELLNEVRSRLERKERK